MPIKSLAPIERKPREETDFHGGKMKLSKRSNNHGWKTKKTDKFENSARDGPT